MAKLNDVLAGNENGHILPFLWMHGEDEQTLREYMQKIYESNIRAVCLESRPHPDFAGPGWWNDVEVILDEARARDMKVWILDDAHFPTGYANGGIASGPEKLRKKYLAASQLDVCGETPSCKIPVEQMCRVRAAPFFGAPSPEGEAKAAGSLLAVLASPLTSQGVQSTETLDLTCKVENGELWWDVPAGLWRISVVYVTCDGGGAPDYINLLDEESCRVLIDQVYEPHYRHFAKDFGRTIAGFFSDEPQIGNTPGYSFRDKIGHAAIELPWSSGMPRELALRLGPDWKRSLPLLWGDCDDAVMNARARWAFMDAVTSLVERCFSGQIGKWCSEHGVEYIGHVVEDDGMHARLGAGIGHYFRGLAGQHMAGIDAIGTQLIPGGQHSVRVGNLMSSLNGEFYHFLLGKLGSSLGHIDPRKKGRCLCEIFGATGWDMDTHTMKFLLDHFLCQGINRFVPHAFSPKDFPDPECPPHFYAHGHNPQFRHFGELMRYAGRLCALLDGGRHISPAAILYHGEAEWAGTSVPDERPARILSEMQIDFDILPADVFADPKRFNANTSGGLSVNGESYKVLIVPYSEYITPPVARFAASAAKTGFPVIFMDALPSGICGGADISTDILKDCIVCPENELEQKLCDMEIADIHIAPGSGDIRYYCYAQAEQRTYMFMNESPWDSYLGEVTLPESGEFCLYDAMNNRLTPAIQRCECGKTILKLEIGACASVIAVSASGIQPSPKPEYSRSVELGGSWELSFSEAKTYPDFKDTMEINSFENLGRIKPQFTGYARYTRKFNWYEHTESAALEISRAYSGAAVRINGMNAGSLPCPPYVFDIGSLLRQGENLVEIDISTTLARRMCTDGMLSPVEGYLALRPSGILGKVRILY